MEALFGLKKKPSQRYVTCGSVQFLTKIWSCQHFFASLARRGKPILVPQISSFSVMMAHFPFVQYLWVGGGGKLNGDASGGDSGLGGDGGSRGGTIGEECWVRKRMGM